jgi:glycosyltransferase involved in cell wall biosynthesis
MMHRVLQVNKLYDPHIGGIETIVRDLSQELASKCDLEVLVCQPKGKLARDVVNGVRVTRASSFGIYRSMPVSASFPFLLRDMARRCDIVHLHHPFPLGEISALSINHRQKLVFTFHSAIVRQKWLGRLYRPFLNQLLHRVDRIIVTYPDAHLRNDLLKPHRDKCRVICPGIDVQNYALDEAVKARVERVRKQYPDNLVLFVGRLVYYKGLHHLVSAMKDVKGTLLIVGDGPLRSRLAQQAVDLHIKDRVHFLGQLSDEDMRACFHACQVFALPSTRPSEAFGMVQLEAMACGKPIVNTRLGTGVEFVSMHGETGLTVEPGDESGLASAINSLLADPQLSRRYGENGRRRVHREFTLQVMADRTLELYREISSNGEYRAKAAGSVPA